MAETCPFCKRHLQFDNRRWQLIVCDGWGWCHILESVDHPTGPSTYTLIVGSKMEAS